MDISVRVVYNPANASTKILLEFKNPSTSVERVINLANFLSPIDRDEVARLIEEATEETADGA